MTAMPRFKFNEPAPFFQPKQMYLDIQGELIVDLFAGGGGMSEAFFMATGRDPEICINHSEIALSVHAANHPNSRHFISDVFEVCPLMATEGRPVGWLHLSPDCTHFSQASGGQPRSKQIRGLSWVGYRWAAQVRPRVISLENVTQILKWGPLIAKRDKATGRVLKRDASAKDGWSVAQPGERVPVQDQFLIPDPKREGETWRKFIQLLEKLGYEVKTDISTAANLGGHTTRTRLFMIARCDGKPVVIPNRTHFKKPEGSKRRKQWKQAADCIDWSIHCPSIFDRKKELARATLERIAKGINKYVLENPSPFIVESGYMSRDTNSDHRDAVANILSTPIMAKLKGNSKGTSMTEPYPTITGGGNSARPAGDPHSLGVVSPILVGAGGPHYSGKPVSGEAPFGTLLPENHRGLAAVYMCQQNGGKNTNPGHPLDEPVSTITNSGSQQYLTFAHLTALRNHANGTGVDEPIPAMTAGGTHHGLVTAFLSRQFGKSIGSDLTQPGPTDTAGGGGKSALMDVELSPSDFEYNLTPEQQAGALRVAAFLIRYYGEGGQWGDLSDPMHTITTKDRLALVTVYVKGYPYVIIDIGFRMLTPRELFRGQDFPDSYIIDRGHDGRVITKSDQVRMVGNSVNPVQALAYILANGDGLAIRKAQRVA